MEFKEIKTHTSKKNTCIQTHSLASPKHHDHRESEREKENSMHKQQSSRGMCGAHNKIYVAYSNLYFGIINTIQRALEKETAKQSEKKEKRVHSTIIIMISAEESH